MNTKLFLLAAAICFLGLNKADAQLKMESGKTDMSIKIGAPFLQTSKFNSPPYDDYKANLPAIGMGFETGFFDNVSCGFEINYSTYKTDVTKADGNGTIGHNVGEMSIFNVMVFAKYFTPIKFAKLATYVRGDFLPLAAYKKSGTIKYNTGAEIFGNDNGVKTTYGIYGGANYQLAGPLSAFGELGYGYTALNVGISLRVGDK